MSSEAKGAAPRTDGDKQSSKMKGNGKGKKSDNLSKRVQLNPLYHKHDFKQQLGEAFREGKSLEDTETKASLISSPFPVCTLPAFVKDHQFLERLKDELLDQIFYEKNNDLYKFQQSDDLRKISTPHVKALRRFLNKEVLDWMRDVTGIQLTDKVDLTCSKYEYTDTLLCHDDELEGRRIAFILYLVPPWKHEDGGKLDLFNMDEHYQPQEVVKSIAPQRNQFTWFEVTPASHHQVAEVLTEDKTRLSVGGWFHGPSVPRPPQHLEVPPPLMPHICLDEEVLYEWINPIYLDFEVQSQIQEKFEADSEIELQGFLKEDKYAALVQALTETGIHWNHIGPANKRNYNAASEESMPEVIKQCLTFFRSEAMFLTLSNLTGLRLHALAPEDSDSDGPGPAAEVHSESEKDEGNDGDNDDEDQDSLKADEDDGHHSSSSSECEAKTKPKKKRRKLNSGGSEKLSHIIKAESSLTSDALAGASSSSSSSSTSLTNTSNNNTAAENLKVPKACNPKCRGEVRRWTHGNYTLVHDCDSQGFDFALDAMLFACCKGWQPEHGGYTSYIAKGEDEELLTVNPGENSLALVYRDKETMRFVKHVNHRIRDMGTKPEFFDISFSYYE